MPESIPYKLPPKEGEELAGTSAFGLPAPSAITQTSTPPQVTSPTETESRDIIRMTQAYWESANFVAGSAGWRLNFDGSFEGSTGTFRGKLIGGELHVPDEDTTANSFHVNNNGDSFWGATPTVKHYFI